MWVLVRISLKTARLAITLSSRFGVHYHPSLGALRAVCRVSRVHVPCVIRCLPPPAHKAKPAGPNNLGATSSLRTRVRAPASVPFLLLFVRLYFSVLSIVFYMLVFFARILYSYVLMYFGISFELHGSLQLLPSLCRDIFHRGYSIIQVWARVPCVTRAFAVYSGWRFFSSKKKTCTW